MKFTSLLLVLIIGLLLFSPLSSVAQKSVRQSQETKTAKELAIEFYEKARALEKQEKYREAIESYTASISLDPDNPRAYVGRGDAKWGLENLREAIEDYDKAIRIYSSWEPEKPEKKAGDSTGNVPLREFEDMQARPKAYEARRGLGPVYFKRGLAKKALGDRVGACTDFRESCKWDEIDCKDVNKLCSNESAEARTTPDIVGTQRQSISSGLEGTRWQATHPGEVYSPILERSLNRQFFCSFEKQGRVICNVIATASSKIIYVPRYDVNRRRIDPKPELLRSMTLPTENRVGTYTQNGNSLRIELSAYEIEATVKGNSMEGEITFKLESSQKARWVAKRITEETSNSSTPVARTTNPISKSKEQRPPETIVSSANLKLGTYTIGATLFDYSYGVRTEEALTIKLRIESVARSGAVKARLFHSIQEGQLNGRVNEEGILELKGLTTWSKKVAASTFTFESRITLKAIVKNGKLVEGEYLMIDTSNSSEKKVVFNSITWEENY